MKISISPKFDHDSFFKSFPCVVNVGTSTTSCTTSVLHLIRYRFPRHSSSWSFQSAFHNHKNDARGRKRNIGYTVDNASLTVFYDVALEVARVRKQISRLTEGDRHWSRHQGPGGRLMGVRNDSEHHPFPANEGEEGKEDGRHVARWWPSCGWLDARRVNECARGVN